MAMAALAAPVFAQLPVQKMLTVEVASTIAQEAMMKCRADGYRVTVTVVDSANTMKAYLHDDGAPLATIEVGRMKANTVIMFGRGSGGRGPATPGAPAAPPVIPGTINAAGGVPIKVGDQIIGAVSVSGAPGGDKDEACATAALARVADKLK